jgi:putative DNA primase/helicase
MGYRDEMDTLAKFIADCCVVGEMETATARELYAEYVQWAKDGGENPKSQNWFGRHLAEKGYDQTRSTAARSWIGIGVAGPNP